MEQQLQQYMETIKEDYRNWWLRCDKNSPDYERNMKIRTEMVKEFNEGVHYKKGKKYIKVITGNSVHSFIVATDNDKQFAKGDILKAASWAAPARNQARGNIFAEYTIRWTGALYLS